MSNETDKPIQANGGAEPGKRKRNRKKKPKNKASDTHDKSDNDQQAEEKASTTTLSPHAKLRNSLLAKGFKDKQIDQAMEEMWNKELAYDEYGAVLKYLNSGGKEEQKQANGSASATTTTKTKDKKKPAENGHREGGVQESKETEAEEKPPKSEVGSNKSSGSAAKTMAAKLDMVAGFENMTDAIFALTEWVNQVAKPHEVSPRIALLI
jgi:hypothetical protein